MLDGSNYYKILRTSKSLIMWNVDRYLKKKKKKNESTSKTLIQMYILLFQVFEFA